MGLKTIILNSEVEFRHYVILHSKEVQRTVIFQDTLDHTIFFYAFLQNMTIVATKEPSYKGLHTYQRLYAQLAINH